MSNSITHPVCQVRGNNIVIYNKTEYSTSCHKLHFKKQSLNFKNAETYDGTLTPSAKKRLNLALSLLVQSSPVRKVFNSITNKYEAFMLNFITLTIPDNITPEHTHDLNNTILKGILQYFIRVHQVHSYVWKLEYQKRGSVHYHITTSTWIHYQAIRNKWNYLLSRYKLMSDYQLKYKSADPNSTDVHTVYKISDFQRYMAKEFAKSCQNNAAIKGKVWGCSQNLSSHKYFSFDMNDEVERLIAKVDRKMRLTCFETDHATIISGIGNWAHKVIPKNHRDNYANFLASINPQLNTLKL